MKDWERRGTLHRRTVTPPIAMGSSWFYLSGDKAEAWVPWGAGAVEYTRNGPVTSPWALTPAKPPRGFAIGDHCKFCGRVQLSSTSAKASDGRTVFARALCLHRSVPTPGWSTTACYKETGTTIVWPNGGPSGGGCVADLGPAMG